MSGAVNKREIQTTIRAMLCFVPQDKTEMREALEKVSRDSGYKAPEIQHECWFELGMRLEDYIKPPQKPDNFRDWERAVLAVFSDKHFDSIVYKHPQ